MAKAAGRGPRADRGSARLTQIGIEASRLFVEKGYDGTSMQDVADAVGLTKAGLYHFVESKEALLWLIVDQGVARVERDVIAPALAVKDPLERLATLIRLQVENISRIESDSGNPVTAVVNDLIGLSEARRVQINARLRKVFDLVRDALEELKSTGRLTEGLDTTVASFSIIGMIEWTNRWRRPNGRLSAADVAASIVELALHGVART